MLVLLVVVSFAASALSVAEHTNNSRAVQANSLNCPPGYVVPPIASGRCYATISSGGPSWSWQSARARCQQAVGGDVAVITSQVDYNNLLVNGCGGTNPSKLPAWFGLYNKAVFDRGGTGTVQDCGAGAWTCWSLSDYAQVRGASMAWIAANPFIWIDHGGPGTFVALPWAPPARFTSTAFLVISFLAWMPALIDYQHAR